jgi:hypothetical protein
MNIRDMLELPKREIRQNYRAEGIDKVIIDTVEFTNYKAFSFIWEKSYIKSPVRSNSGAIANLDSYATFLTPHLKIDFSLLSIDDYRNLMKLAYSKNEFDVTCYDVVYNTTTTNKMYFSTEEMPKLWTIAEIVNSGEELEEIVCLLGVQDYTVELIGTNNDVDTVTITYAVNAPTGVTIYDNVYTEWEKSVDIPKNISLSIGDDALFPNRVNNETFGGKYKFQNWKDKTGFTYIDGNAYYFMNDTTLYAQWVESDK